MLINRAPFVLLALVRSFRGSLPGVLSTCTPFLVSFFCFFVFVFWGVWTGPQSVVRPSAQVAVPVCRGGWWGLCGEGGGGDFPEAVPFLFGLLMERPRGKGRVPESWCFRVGDYGGGLCLESTFHLGAETHFPDSSELALEQIFSMGGLTASFPLFHFLRHLPYTQ